MREADAIERLFMDARGRFHWPWRLVTFACFTLAAWLLGSTLVYPVLSTLWRALFGGPMVAYAWLMLFALGVAHAMMPRTADPSLTLRALGLGREALAPRSVLGALGGGVAAIGVPSALLLAVGWLSLEPNEVGGWTRAALGALTMLVPAALSEELTFRGYPFVVLRERFGAVAAVAVTSVAFALLHLANPGAGVRTLSLVALAGVWLGVVRVVTGSLWASFAAHLAWNAVMAIGLHMPVSGMPFATPGYRIVDTGPAWATGGAWGPEGGLVAALGMLVVTAILLSRPEGRASFARPVGRKELHQ